MSRCGICEGPATMHIGAGPRCDAHQYHPGETLAALRDRRAHLDALIAERETFGRSLKVRPMRGAK